MPSNPRPGRGVWRLAGLGTLVLVSATACTTGSAGPQDTTAVTRSTPPPASATAPVTPPSPTGDSSPDETDGGSPSPPSSGASAGAGSTSGSPTGAAPKTVPVQITIHDWNGEQNRAEIDAFVPGVVVSGGTCTLVLTHGDAERQTARSSITTPSSTSCGLMSVPGDQLSAGTWQAVVHFDAPTATGQSDRVSVQVPAS